MLVRDVKRVALIVGLIFGILLINVSLWGTDAHSSLRAQVGAFFGKPFAPNSSADQETQPNGKSPTAKPLTDKESNVGNTAVEGTDVNATHHEIFSLSTADKKYFAVKFDDFVTFNPSIIPHPIRKDTWIIVAQKHRPVEVGNFHVELGCNAGFVDGALKCLEPASILPIAATKGGKCVGKFGAVNYNIGPHDARVFYGPKKPYIIFGSNSQRACFGMWIQDFRMLVEWGFEFFTDEDFRAVAELQRPPPYGVMEKNFFVFWDGNNERYVHHDTAPKRVFAKLAADGSVGPDLAPAAANTDDKCITRYLPKPASELESIHQATNSLKITMCKRADRSCKPNDDNTFIVAVVQHKTYYDYHSEYDPYVVVFRQRAPFEVYGISRKPLWIHGRGRVNDKHTEMLYVASMNWKARDVKYHGYLDDELILGFGIEDKQSGAIDVRASDLLGDLGLCSDPE
ncbi:hypothetical protein B0T24DRAFT_532429 [Lasiosphaeria ovina]|uniref:Uncharacterized protein n=1 Tax=Lasiosphaeria ovina TaxID=92902 RepID=A0AAE0K467_9PEZI|nr:hypothetical protein B0T24DRAFT_532429 [Lasiosphaeria ovina]